MEDELDLLPLSKRLKLLVSMKPSSPLVVSSVPSPPECSGGVSVETVLNDVYEKWPGLPRGVKFDPSDEDLLWHLLGKIGKGKAMPHPFINMFVTSLDDDIMIGYTHPDLLPGIKQDGRPSYFFHRILKTQSERQNICWNKIGKAKPVLVDGIYPGCKKIMILYVNEQNGEKLEKTNWVMHQYQLGAEEVEEGALVVSKVFYQQRPKASTKGGQDMASDSIGVVLNEVKPLAGAELVVSEAHSENQHSDINDVLKLSQMSTCYQIGSNDDYFEQQKMGYGNHPESFASEEEKCAKSCECGHNQMSSCDLDQDVRRCQKDAPVFVSTSTPNSSESVIAQSPSVAVQILSITNSGKSNSLVQTDYHTESKEIGQILSCQVSDSDINSDHQTCDTSKTNELEYLRTNTCAPEKNINSSYMVSDARSYSDSPSSVIPLSLESQDSNHRQSYETRTLDANLSPSQELKPKHINGDNLLLDPLFPVKVKHEPSEGEVGSTCEVHDVVTHYASKENHSQDDNLSGGRNIQNCLSLSGLPLESPFADAQCSKKAAKYPDNVLLGKDNMPAESDSIGYGRSLHPEERNLKTVNRHSNSASSNSIGKVKFEPLENCIPVPGQTDLPTDEVKIELANDNSSDIDNIPLIDRMRMRVSLSVPEVECSGKKRCPEPTALPASSFDSFNSENPKRKSFSLRKKRKKTATNSVETALEEDAPGLLEVLLDKGITAEEIKLYGDVDDDDDVGDVFSNEDSFEDLESVITKFFSERSSLFKLPSSRHVKGSKVDYCLPCLIALIEQ
ncbi:NAC domain-containing protein [Dioscorea alata]|nr:NAC domain-containing protein [Dioscorea alata]